MKTFASLAAFMAILVVVVGSRLAAISQPDETAATLQLSSEVKDFGTVTPDQHLHGSFSIQNTGSRRLILHQDGASCCGQPAPKPLIVPPGQTATVPVDVRAPTEPGLFEKPLAFTTNDPGRPRFELVIRAVVGSPPGK
jgi:hypothetical protein